MNLHKDAPSDGAAASSADAAAFDAFLQANPEVQYIDCVFADLCGAVRGKRIARAELEGVFVSGLQVPYTIYFLDARGDVVDGLGPQVSPAGSEGTAKPIPRTLTRVNWSQRPHGQVLMTLCDAKGGPYFGEPRNVLRRVVERFAGTGIAPSVGCDFAFSLIDRERPKNGIVQARAAVDRSKDADVLEDVAHAAAAQGLSTAAAALGAVPGQYRIRLKPLTDVLRAGDEAVFLRQIVRAVARQHGLDATFMAKPHLNAPGNALRIQTSLAPTSGASVRQAVGGLQVVMGESIALFAPNANSYRRFAPGEPIGRNKRWGSGNAATVLDVQSGQIKHRLPGADTNPYLAMAAILAGMHHGIVEETDPGPAFEGDATTFVDQTLPFSADAALVALENGSIMREYLGPAYVDLYCATKRAELERFRNHIPAHEYDWYL